MNMNDGIQLVELFFYTILTESAENTFCNSRQSIVISRLAAEHRGLNPLRV